MFKNKLSQKNLKVISKNFLEEIKTSYKGTETSLRFLIHELSPTSLIEDGEKFQAIVIGGSVFKKALLKKTKKEIKILKIENEKNIYFKDANNFLDFVLRELYSDIKTIALNFAYPLRPLYENGKLDGIFLSVTKGVNLHDLLDKRIGREIENYVLTKTNKKIRVAVANDTICLTLSGLTKYKWGNLAAGIVGTGINFALFTDKNHLVNLESASFNRFPQTPEGKVVDQQSNKPGRALFEKETAGAYLYKHFNIILKENNINYPDLASTEQLDKLSRENIPQVSELSQNLLKRSAQLVACQIAGIELFKKQNMTFVMEGSLFWKGNNYKKTVEETVKQLVPEYKVNFVEIENSAILGAAKLVS